MPDKSTVAEWSKLCKKHDPHDPGLDSALRDYVKSLDKEVDEQIEALEHVVAKAEAARKKNSTIDEVTDFLDDVLTDARQTLTSLENEEPEPDGLLNDERAYKKYLKRVLTKIKKLPMYFAIGLGRRPEDHRIVFHKKKAGKALLKTIKDETDLGKFAWGFAGAHEEEAGVLTLALESPQVSGLKKKAQLLLKYFKPLPFDTIMLMVEGEEVQDIPETDDVDGAAEKARLIEALKRLKPLIDKAIEADPNRKNEILESMSQISGEIKQGQLAEAKSNIVALHKLVQGLVAQKQTAGPTDDPQLRKRYEAAKERVEPRLTDARQAKPEKADALLRLWNYAIDQGAAGNYPSANTALEKLSAALDQVLGASETPSGDPIVIWREAREKCDRGIMLLQNALKSMDHPDLDRIVEFGLNGLTEGMQTRLMAALLDLRNAQGEARQRAAATLASRASELRKALESDPIVELCENNPFGVAVSIREPLGSALAELERLANAT